MAQLIIIVIGLALASALIMVGLDYTPTWFKAAERAESITIASLQTLEAAYNIATIANNGVSPAVKPAYADGGFASIFSPVFVFTPALVPLFAWTYGETGGVKYFCMGATAPVDEGAIRGIYRAKAVFSTDQVFVNSTCGAQTNFEARPAAPATVAVTMFVSYVPGLAQ